MKGTKLSTQTKQSNILTQMYEIFLMIMLYLFEKNMGTLTRNETYVIVD